MSFIDSLWPICEPDGPKIGYMGTLVVGSHLKGAAGAGGGLFEDQGDVLALQPLLLIAAVLGCFQIRRQLEQELELFRGEVQFLEEIPVA